MEDKLYSAIFKRKSFHTFIEKSNEKISQEELDDVLKFYDSLKPLDPNIKTAIKIEKTKDTNCHRDAEYCILFFSEKKDNYLQNIGYLGEMVDLYLVSKNIGSLWFGIAKCDEVYKGLDYVIMIAISKVKEGTFRKDMFKAKRKELVEIWEGDDLNLANIVRFAPSACNSQPWFVENKESKLCIYRKSKSGRVGIMPKGAATYFNQIDIGIFMCFIELCLNHECINFVRTLYKDNGSFDNLELNAIYQYEIA